MEAVDGHPEQEITFTGEQEEKILQGLRELRAGEGLTPEEVRSRARLAKSS
jgi:hypothetical protein